MNINRKRTDVVGFTLIELPAVRRRESRAFTLIELVVAMSIIALLIIGLMLPAVAAVRAFARNAVCLGNLLSVGQTLAFYAEDNRGDLAGPNTSGRFIKAGTPPQAFEGATTPTEIWDWISPTMGVSLGLSSDPVQRYRDIFTTKRRCPENQEFYAGPFGGPPDYDLSGLDADLAAGVLNVSSYSANRYFHLEATGPDGQGVAGGPMHNNVSPRFSFWATLPAGYVPKLERVGRASNKVYALDGARFVADIGVVSFSLWTRANIANNFMVDGPWNGARSGEPYERDLSTLELTEDAKRHAYRHNERLNTVYFDGHAKTEPDAEVVDFRKYWPSGTDFKGAQFTYFKDGENGIIP